MTSLRGLALCGQDFRVRLDSPACRKPPRSRGFRQTGVSGRTSKSRPQRQDHGGSSYDSFSGHTWPPVGRLKWVARRLGAAVMRTCPFANVPWEYSRASMASDPGVCRCCSRGGKLASPWSAKVPRRWLSRDRPDKQRPLLVCSGCQLCTERAQTFLRHNGRRKVM